ncbi:MAG TPA: hypothetical protein VK807_16565 [Gemmatimonadaceae bacterium]|nr:hypothetical protein [Gemmatimonadaceae bacterium]
MPSLTIWTRLEPRCRSADLSAALEARTHDPLWMLTRQWQFGEMQGDDAGSPILATVATLSVPLNRYVSGTSAPVTLPTGTPLETFTEREVVRPSGSAVEYRQSADAGLYFVRLLSAGGVASLAPAYLTQYPITAPTTTLDAPAAALAAVVAGRVPDGVRLAADLRDAQPNLPAAPAIPSGDKTAVQTAATAFLAWFDSVYDAPAPGGAIDPPAWVDERMEYHFSIDASATDMPCAFLADQYTGDRIDWPSFDYAAKPLGSVTAAPAAVTRTIVPAPVTFKGMPARRYWQLEDANVDLGAIEAGPTDLARLMLREFALIYGNDWFVMPVAVVVGSVTRVTSLVVTDTFGITQTIPHYASTPDGGRWRMFAISGDALDHRLILPPVLAQSQTSLPQEQVLLVRDDAASLAWGVEMIVAGASGASIDRATTAAAAAPTPPPPSASTARQYVLGTSAPSYYFPYIAQPIDATQQRLVRAAFLSTDGSRVPITPLGRLLAPEVPMFEEEFIQEGVRVERFYRLARWTDGSTHLWLARRKVTGAVAGASGLTFDQIEAQGQQ